MIPLGQVMIGVDALELSPEEHDLLQHPQVAGIILFKRNYQSPEQLGALVTSIQSLRQPALLVAVDHEGGRVQRFRDGFTHLPAARRLGQCYEQNHDLALQLAQTVGWLLASELRACGIDFSFAPVLDLDHGCCPAIGDRALHRDPAIVAQLASALTNGMCEAGCAAIAKHFPGHGAVNVDSHHAVPIDERSYDTLLAADLAPFQALIQQGISAVMPAHVIYADCDSKPAGFSAFWLQTVLRQRLNFQRAIISDDLDMGGAAWAGSPFERAQQALTAGCDLVLACNDRDAACAILDNLRNLPGTQQLQRLEALRATGASPISLADLQSQARWRHAQEQLAAQGLLLA